MSQRLSLEDIQEKVDLLFPEEDLTVISYYSMVEPIILYCNNCGTTFSHSTGRSFLGRKRSCGCAHCNSKLALRHKEILKAIEEKYNILDTYYRDYKNKKIEMKKIECKNCGHIRDVRFSTFLQSPNCGCEENSRYAYRTKEEFLKEINNKAPEGKYELLSEYIDTKTKIRLRHSCGFIWDVRPNALLKKDAAFCPRCGNVESKGARYVSKILDELNISYEREKTLLTNKCRFDFYFILNEQEYAIEYNGKQHYIFIPHFTKTEEEFKELQARDAYKKEYCLLRNIKLLTLPYNLTNQEIKTQIYNFVGSTTTGNGQG